MTLTEYLEQGRRLDERINYKLRKMQELRRAACSPRGSWNTEDLVSSSHREEAAFVQCLELIEKMEAEINREIDQLVELKAQMTEMFRALGRSNYEMVLTYRYLESMSWDEISVTMLASLTSVKRWHREALDRLTLPEHPIVIGAGRVSEEDG